MRSPLKPSLQKLVEGLSFGLLTERCSYAKLVTVGDDLKLQGR
jgi:hypothetical protein